MFKKIKQNNNKENKKQRMAHVYRFLRLDARKRFENEDFDI